MKRAEQAIAWATDEVLYEVGRRGLLALGGPDGVEEFWRNIRAVERTAPTRSVLGTARWSQNNTE